MRARWPGSKGYRNTTNWYEGTWYDSEAFHSGVLLFHLPMLLSSQQTVCAEQDPELPTPMIWEQFSFSSPSLYYMSMIEQLTVMGEHVRPTSASTSCTTMPRSPKRSDAEGLLADSTRSQHWIEPVVQLSPEDGEVGMAAARKGRLRETREGFMSILNVRFLSHWAVASAWYATDAWRAFLYVHKKAHLQKVEVPSGASRRICEALLQRNPWN